MRSELNIEAELMQTFTMTSIQTEKKIPESNSPLSYNLIPKAVLSMKVLQELPIIVVPMYQLYKRQVHNEVAEFIPLICPSQLSVLTICPQMVSHLREELLIAARHILATDLRTKFNGKDVR